MTDVNHLASLSLRQRQTKEQVPLIQDETKMVDSHPLNSRGEDHTKGHEKKD